MGDKPGHPFYGNQWTHGKTFSAASEERNPTIIAGGEVGSSEASGIGRAAVLTMKADRAMFASPAELQMLHREAMALAKVHNLETFQEDLVATDEERMRLEANAVLLTVASLEVLPPAVRDYVREKGLFLELTSPTAEHKFTVNGKQMVEGGHASGYLKDLEVTLVSHDNSRSFGTTLVGHEMGHVQAYVAGNIIHERMEDAQHERNQLHSFDNLQTARDEMRRTVRVLERLAENETNEIRKGNHLHELQRVKENLAALYPFQERALSAEDKRRDWNMKHMDALVAIEKASREEGGVTSYAEAWVQASIKQEGTAHHRKPLDSGGHETLAEIEGLYLNAARRAGLTPEMFADLLAKGTLDMAGGKTVRERQVIGGTRPTSAYPKTAKAWLSLRKTLSTKDAAVRKREVRTFSKEEQAEISRRLDGKTWKQWQAGREALEKRG